VLLRRRDVAWLAQRLGSSGDDALVDHDPDEPVAEFPYGYPHLRVGLRGFAATSIGIVVQRTERRPPPERSRWRRAGTAMAAAGGAAVRALEHAVGELRRRRPRRRPDG
jgi:hypothetical protein